MGRSTYNLLGGRKRSNNLPDLQHQLFGQIRIIGIVRVKFRLHRDERVYSLTRDVVVTSYDGRLGDSLV